MASHTTEATIRRMSRALLIRVGVGFAVLMAVLIGAGVLLDGSHRAIIEDLDRIALIEEPESAAAYEMEINILGAGLAVEQYVLTGDPRHRARFSEEEADFDRARAEYERLSDNPEEKALGKRIDEINRRHRAAGLRLMALRDERESYNAHLSVHVSEIEAELRSEDLDWIGRELGFQTRRGVDDDVADLGTWLGNYLILSRDDRGRIPDDIGEVETRLNTFGAVPLNPAEAARTARLREIVAHIRFDLGEIARLREAMGETEREFNELRDAIDVVLDERVQALTRQDLREAQEGARANLVRWRAVGISLIAICALVAVGVAGLISRRSAALGSASADELLAAFTDLRASETRRGELLERLVSAQEEERGRIARELHDQLGQSIFAISLGLDSLRRSLPAALPADDALPQMVRDLQGLTQRLLGDVHQVAWKLRPAALDDLGLRGALSNLVETVAGHSGVAIDLVYHLSENRLPAHLETTLFRVVQEALTNVSRHSGARSAGVVVQRNADTVRLVVEDDGRGFAPDQVLEQDPLRGRLGLLGMKERIAHMRGTIEIDSAPGRGTTIIVSIPLPDLVPPPTP